MKQKAPHDFQIMRDGIHPFYSNMSFEQFLEAAVGWTIVSVERNSSDDPDVTFEKGGKSIEIGYYSEEVCRRDIGKPARITSEFTVMPDGEPATEKDVDEIASIVGKDLTLSEEDSDEDGRYYEDGDSYLMVWATPYEFQVSLFFDPHTD